MRPIRKTLELEGTSTGALPLDIYIAPFQVSYNVQVISEDPEAEVSYTVQYTLDDVYAPDFDENTAYWVTETTASSTVTSELNYVSTAIRVNADSLPSGSTLKIAIIQAGLTGV